MFQWTPDGKTFGKGPKWGVAQTGQNVGRLLNKKKLRQPASTRRAAADVRRVRHGCSRRCARSSRKSEPVIEFGNKEGYGTIHFFGGIQGAYVRGPAVRELDLPRSRARRFETPGTIKALDEARRVGQGRLLQRRLQRGRLRRRRRRVREGQGRVRRSAATGTPRSSRRASARERRRDAPCRPARAASTSASARRSGPWHISAKTKYPDVAAAWLNYIDHVAERRRR